MTQLANDSLRTALPEDVRAWVEETAMLFEVLGRHQRSSGRILALLLITEEPALSQAELAAQLELSLASVSTALRLLVDSGMVEKTRTPGVRGDRYRVVNYAESSFLLDIAKAIETYGQQFQRGLGLVDGKRPQLQAMADIHGRMVAVLRQALDAE